MLLVCSAHINKRKQGIGQLSFTTLTGAEMNQELLTCTGGFHISMPLPELTMICSYLLELTRKQKVPFVERWGGEKKFRELFDSWLASCTSLRVFHHDKPALRYSPRRRARRLRP